MKAALLPDRGVVKVSGPDARGFLNGLVTTDIEQLQPGAARFGALLTPQGKIITDLLVTETADGALLFDCPKALAKPFADRLTFYRLRAKVTIENLSEQLGVLAIWGGEPTAKPNFAFADPRDARLGSRIILRPDDASQAAASLDATLLDASAFEAHRIACGTPRGGLDFAYGDAFPHETNMDRLHGVDFGKGCYVGQEVVSRMQHRGTARTRVIRVAVNDGAPEPGTAITAGEKSIGTMGSSAEGRGLALLRMDRASDALDAGEPLLAGGIPITLVSPDDVRPQTKAHA